MRISVFGLGYVGAVSSACLAAGGHQVIGVDKNATKVDLINRGASPIIEAGVDEIIRSASQSGNLQATSDAARAVRESELSLVCVGTPSEVNGSLKLDFVRKVCEEIGAALRTLERYHVVVIRSTILPGTMRSVVIPTLEQQSGKQAGADFGVCFNPEFLREGTAVNDYYHPPKTVIGELEARAGDRLMELYADLDAPVFRTSLDVAEMVKYVDNTWHALKVGFANEIGAISKALSIDSFEVMDIFCRDTRLNLSPYYLRPGYAFGGSCLPKDVRALTYRARTLDVDTPLLNAILPSNEAHIRRGIDLVLRTGQRKVGVLGFSFKAGTDDLRESPIVELIERLIGKGFDLQVYDRNVNLAKLTGANRDYILNHIPHIAKLMRETMEEVLDHADVIVIGNGAAEFTQVPNMLRAGQKVIDLVRVKAPRGNGAQYAGICW
ncbi:MAG: nucleotide sugar dehydrogenase [Steroidobacteraceae bacterium]|nr:nucleotide sugar dehydrogenase [Steroidobacteraceae bacterium]